MTASTLPSLAQPDLHDIELPELPPYAQWTLQEQCPGEWPSYMDRFHAGFFHSPLAPGVVAPLAQPLFATLSLGGSLAGIAVGARSNCRFSAHPRHVYFPTLPVFAIGVSPEPLMASLLQQLRADGAQESTFDSFDAVWAPYGGGVYARTAERHEYVVTLAGAPSELAATFSHQHQRHLKRGERDKWRFDSAPADRAVDSLAVVSENAAARAAIRGRGFNAAHWELPRNCHAASPRWGLSVFRAFNDDTLLAALLIGWTEHRAFYLGGGSTPDGYARSASVWLHWRTMSALRAQGVSAYNLGGAPAAAADESHPSHGLHRFKTGFGATVQRRSGLRWTARTLHVTMHRAARRFAGAPASVA